MLRLYVKMGGGGGVGCYSVSFLSSAEIFKSFRKPIITLNSLDPDKYIQTLHGLSASVKSCYQRVNR